MTRLSVTAGRDDAGGVMDSVAGPPGCSVGAARVWALLPARDAGRLALEGARPAGLIGIPGATDLSVWVPEGADVPSVAEEAELLQSMLKTATVAVAPGSRANRRHRATASPRPQFPRCGRPVPALRAGLCPRCRQALMGAPR
jgi:hypothetical protein